MCVPADASNCQLSYSGLLKGKDGIYMNFSSQTTLTANWNTPAIYGESAVFTTCGLSNSGGNPEYRYFYPVTGGQGSWSTMTGLTGKGPNTYSPKAYAYYVHLNNTKCYWGSTSIAKSATSVTVTLPYTINTTHAFVITTGTADSQIFDTDYYWAKITSSTTIVFTRYYAATKATKIYYEVVENPDFKIGRAHV